MSEYNGSVTGFSTQVSTSSLSNGVALRDSGWNTDTTSGIYTFNKFSDNIWMFSGRNNKGFASGSVSLDSSLTRIRLFTSSIFNNGSVNVSYELSN
jgi:hypothetical protein